MKYRMILLLSLLLTLLAPQTSSAAVQTSAVNASALVASADNGISFRIVYNAGVYEVYMTPSATAAAPGITLTAQVTLKTPRNGEISFDPTNVTSTVAGTAWSLTSRIDAPAEDPNADYLSFTVEFPDGDYRAFQWVANQEVKVFTFENANACLGAVSLMSNDDAFAQLPNSVGTNPGNQIDVMGMGEGNAFMSVAGAPALCSQDRSLENKVFLPIMLK